MEVWNGKFFYMRYEPDGNILFTNMECRSTTFYLLEKKES